MKYYIVYVGLSLASGALAASSSAPKENPEVTMTEGFTWVDPFTAETLANFSPSCDVLHTFPATQYTLHNLFTAQPNGLLNWAESLKKVFTGRPFPGGWDGLDAHLHNRNILMMKYSDVPIKVREWIENEERINGKGKGLFAVYPKAESMSHRVKETVKFADGEGGDREKDEDRVVIFAPGAIYGILPLWVAEGSGCEADLLDLEKYSEKAVDGGVISWPIRHTDPVKGRDIEFTIKAQVLRASESTPKSQCGAGKGDCQAESEVPGKLAAETPGTEATAEEEPVHAKDEL